MRIFIAAMVAVSGIAMFAVAALVLDRRRELIGTPDEPGPLLRLAGGRPAGQTGPADPPGQTDVAGPSGAGPSGAGLAAGTGVRQAPAEELGTKRYLPHLVALAMVVIGLGMMIGACGGLLSF